MKTMHTLEPEAHQRAVCYGETAGLESWLSLIGCEFRQVTPLFWATFLNL